MNRRQYLRRWIRALTIHERKLLGPVARERNRFIESAAKSYDLRSAVPTHIRTNHELALATMLLKHYQTVMPAFATMVETGLKSRNRREVKRVTFYSKIMEWARTRALNNASTIADTDMDDVREAIEDGLSEGLGVAEIARNIRSKTDLTPFRAATVARTETHAAATFGAIEEARQSEEELGIKLVKEWLPTMDDRTRPAHKDMAGSEPIPLDAKFEVGGELMDRPGDPSASAENVIACRCALNIIEAP